MDTTTNTTANDQSGARRMPDYGETRLGRAGFTLFGNADLGSAQRSLLDRALVLS